MLGYDDRIAPENFAGNIVGQSERETSILSKYTVDEIMGLAKSRKAQARNELMYVITDLIQETVSGREKELIADILVDLVRQAVRDMREAVAAKLCLRDDVPVKVIQYLAHDDIEVARHVLTNSPLLGEADMLDIIDSKTASYWSCLAKRRELPDAVINAIVDQKKKEPCRYLAQNDNISLTGYAFDVLGEMIKKERDLAEPVLTRRDVPLALAERLYEHVGESMQLYIKQKFGDQFTAKAMRDVTAELANTARNKFKPDDQMRAEAASRKREGKLTLKDTLDTLRRGQIPSFIAMFSEYMGLSERMIEGILREDNGRSLAVICRFQGMSRADFVSIFLMVHKIRSFDMIVPQNHLQKAMKYFDKIDDKLARRLMDEIRAQDTK